MVQADEKQFSLVAKRLEALLKKDVENQGGRAAVAQKLAEFQRDPKAWLAAQSQSGTWGARAEGL